MGSSSSRMRSRPSRGRVNGNNSSLLSYLLCGGSSSRAALEMEDNPADFLVNSAEHSDQITNEVPNPTKKSALIFGTRMGFTSSNTENGSSSESSSSVAAGEGTSVEDGLSNVDTTNRGKCLSEIRELVPPQQVCADCSPHKSSRDRSNTRASDSFREQSSNPVSLNVLANKDSANVTDNSVNKGVSQSSPKVAHPSSFSSAALGGSSSEQVSVDDHASQVTDIHNSDSDSIPEVSDSPLNFLSQGYESLQEVPSGLGFLVSNREQNLGEGNVPHVDVVSIASHILSSRNADASIREARRNSRRLFWDAFSRRSSRRLGDSPTIVFSRDDADDLGSHDRWLMDFGGGFLNNGIEGESGYLSSRIHSLNERRRHSRSEIWERLQGGLDENGQLTTICPTGLHPVGTCLCELFLTTEESTTRASISRIVMLAEALFEVLDEIHRQPVSLALSVVSIPAPESVVDSFPLKSHKKSNIANDGDGSELCYICLAEYEDGDKIRVLPCHHEYHMSCVDKWLKEIHGICPLCRGDVREAGNQMSVSCSEVRSL